jgi:cytochrome c biogenesis protein ResB
LHPKVCQKEKGYQLSLDFGFKLPRTVASVIFHLALVLALIGFIATGFYSWRDSIMVAVGETKDIKVVSTEMKMYKWWDNVYKTRGWEWANPQRRYDMNASFQIRCDDYFSEYIPDEEDWYTLKDYKSDLTAIDGGREVLSKRIEVNYPLIYRAIDFYQENVTQQGKLVITPPQGEGIEVDATIWGTQIPRIEGLGMLSGSSLIWGKLVGKGVEKEVGPKIRIGKKIPPQKKDWPNPGKPKSEMGQGVSMEGMGMQETEWLFVLEDGKPVQYEGYTFELKGPYEKGTGLQVVHDPGVPILWVSIIVIIIMLVFGVYFPHYTARVDVSPLPGGGQRLVVGGRAYGLGSNFRRQAERVVAVLKK